VVRVARLSSSDHACTGVGDVHRRTTDPAISCCGEGDAAPGDCLMMSATW
jgi:hypothetical protein